MTDEMSEGKRKLVDRHATNWENDWRLITDALMERCGLTRSEALLYLAVSYMSPVAQWASDQLAWWGSEERKQQQAKAAEQQDRALAVGERGIAMMERELEEDEDWRGDTP